MSAQEQLAIEGRHSQVTEETLEVPVGPENEDQPKVVASDDLPPEEAAAHVAHMADEQDRQAAAKRAVKAPEELETLVEEPADKQAAEATGFAGNDGLAEKADDSAADADSNPDATHVPEETDEPEHGDKDLQVVAATSGVSAVAATTEKPKGTRSFLRKHLPWFFDPETGQTQKHRVLGVLGAVGLLGAGVAAVGYELLVLFGNHSATLGAHHGVDPSQLTTPQPPAVPPVPLIESSGQGANALGDTLPESLRGLDLRTELPWDVAHRLAPGHEMTLIQQGMDALNATGYHDHFQQVGNTVQVYDGHSALTYPGTDALSRTMAQIAQTK